MVWYFERACTIAANGIPSLPSLSLALSTRWLYPESGWVSSSRRCCDPWSHRYSVTGASSGFGRTMTELALSKGDKVLATLRNPSELADLQATYPADQLHVCRLDVTAPDEIPRAFQEAKAAFGRVDVVFNNAGTALKSEAEGTPPAAARALFEVNFWGAVNVSTEAVRFFREENEPCGGLLLNNSSYLGVVPLSSGAFYSAAKHGMLRWYVLWLLGAHYGGSIGRVYRVARW